MRGLKTNQMSPLSADIFCRKVEAVCDKIGYTKRTNTKREQGILETISSCKMK
jgi:hypothetical protein